MRLKMNKLRRARSLNKQKSAADATTDKRNSVLSSAAPPVSASFLDELKNNAQFRKQRNLLQWEYDRKSLSLEDLRRSEPQHCIETFRETFREKSSSDADIRRPTVFSGLQKRSPDVLKSLEGIPEDSPQTIQRTSPFPVDNDPEIRKHSERHPRHSATIHWMPGNRPRTPQKPDKNANYERVLKVTYDGVTRKISKGHAVKLENGKFCVADEHGKILQTLRDNVRIVDRKLVSKKELELTDNANNTYHLHFDSSKDARQNALARSNSAGEKTTIKNRLLRLLGKRSSRDLLEKKGIIRSEAIFGNAVADLRDKYGVSVPEFVTRTIELIELPENITSQGIYRASGNLATIQKVRVEVDGGNLRILEEYADDVDVLTGALKLFFRELKEPLLSKEVYGELLRVMEMPNDGSRSQPVHRLVNGLAKAHRDAFLTVVDHLLRVETCKAQNKMDVHNLSVVWGPSLLWFPDVVCHGENLLKNSANAVGVMEMVLNAYKESSGDMNKKQHGGSFKSNEPLILDLHRGDGEGNIDHTRSNETLTTSDESLFFGSKDYCLKAPMKAGIFGNSLRNLSDISKQTVPEFVQLVARFVEAHSGCVGVYRQSGDKTRVDRIKKKVAKNRLGSLEKFKDDTHELACALKQFFNELEVPVVTPEVMDAFNVSSADERTAGVRRALEGMHASHRDTLTFLLRHLWTIIGDEENRMTKEAIAIVWAPTLCEIVTNEKAEVDRCVRLVELLLDMHAPRGETGRGKSVYDNVRGEASILDGERKTKL